MQFDGLYKKRKLLQIEGRKLKREHKNSVESSCIKDLKLFINVCTLAKPEVVLFLDLVPLFMIHSTISPLTWQLEHKSALKLTSEAHTLTN